MPAIENLKMLRDSLKEGDKGNGATPFETQAAEVIDAALMDMAREQQYGAWAGQPRPAPTVRVRVNVSDSVKGIRSTDTTLEWFGDLRDYDVDEVIGLRHILTTGVDAKYPPPPLT